MEQQILRSMLERQGYILFNNILDPKLIESLDAKENMLVPQRGHDINNKYWPKNRIHENTSGWALWWSQQLVNVDEVNIISRQLLDRLGYLFDNPMIYVTDIISNTPHNRYIKPHIDTPYRFPKWHDSKELLGVQCIVPLCKFTKENGGTGILPGSHKNTWDVKESYSGAYNEMFTASVLQPTMNPGDVLVYHPRLLHSTMPNYTEKTRRALLIHITSVDMAMQLVDVDNIWNEK